MFQNQLHAMAGPNIEDMQRYLDALPVDEEPLTESEREARAEGLADIAAGRVLTHEQVLAELKSLNS